MRVPVLTLGFIAALFAGEWLGVGPAVAANNSEEQTADFLVKLLQAGRSVVASHQDLINDPGRGNKGFTSEFLADKMIQRFKEQTGIDLSGPGGVPQSAILLTLLESGKEVVAEAQPVINKQGVAFKGFIPAVWGRRTGERFTQKTGIRLKLTAQEYRHPGNKPDEFEQEVLKLFADPAYPKGRPISRVTGVAGKSVLRLMVPEYVDAPCLRCHGEPKGERDITGMKKEGYKEGGLVGAISLVIPVR